MISEDRPIGTPCLGAAESAGAALIRWIGAVEFGVIAVGRECGAACPMDFISSDVEMAQCRNGAGSRVIVVGKQ